MSLVTFLGIYFVRKAGIDLATVGIAFLCEHLLRGLAAPLFGAWSDRVGRRALLIASAALTAVVLPAFLLVEGPASLFAWSLALGFTGAVNMPVSNALLLDLSPPERRQSTLALNYTAMSVAYTLGVMPAGYIAEQGYGLLAAIGCAGYVAVALLYGFFLRTRKTGEASKSGVAETTSPMLTGKTNASAANCSSRGSPRLEKNAACTARSSGSAPRSASAKSAATSR